MKVEFVTCEHDPLMRLNVNPCPLCAKDAEIVYLMGALRQVHDTITSGRPRRINEAVDIIHEALTTAALKEDE